MNDNKTRHLAIVSKCNERLRLALPTGYSMSREQLAAQDEVYAAAMKDFSAAQIKDAYSTALIRMKRWPTPAELIELMPDGRPKTARSPTINGQESWAARCGRLGYPALATHEYHDQTRGIWRLHCERRLSDEQFLAVAAKILNVAEAAE